VTWRSRSAVAVWIVAALGTFAIGGIDYFSGVELRVFPLYYAPVSFIAWYRGRSGTLVASALGALVWFASNWLAGLRFSSPDIWVVNTLVQGLSFVIVGWLIASLRASLVRERGLSRTDPLTALSNRRAFYEDSARSLALCRRMKRPITIAYVDLDDFKTVNDALGHEAGDDVLRKVAEQLRAAVRPSDLSARLGGDEFAVVLPEVGPDVAAATLERLRSILARPASSGQEGVNVSVGGVTFVEAPETVEQMVQRADAGMYEAKKTGKNRVHLEIVGELDK